MLPSLCTVAEAAELGYTVSAPDLARASARMRGYSGQTITDSSSTISARAGAIVLPQQPARAVTAITRGDETITDFELAGQILNIGHCRIGEPVTVTYTHGFLTVPDELKDLCASIAARLAALPTGAAAGVQSESGGNESVTYGFDAFRGVADLVTAEKDRLARFFPPLPGVIALRP